MNTSTGVPQLVEALICLSGFCLGIKILHYSLFENHVFTGCIFFHEDPKWLSLENGCVSREYHIVFYGYVCYTFVIQFV
jgi:hypothetical protein